MRAAVEDARQHLNFHFGQADWSWLKPADLGQHQTSPTEPVRAALVQAALSYLVKDIADAAGASPQQLNVYTLLKRWTADLVPVTDADAAVWDGNDGNDRAYGSGLQLGLCDPIEPSCQVPPVTCNTGSSHSRTFTPQAGNRYFLIVPRNSGFEGSYGKRSDGSERPASIAACLPQLIGCP